MERMEWHWLRNRIFQLFQTNCRMTRWVRQRDGVDAQSADETIEGITG